MKILHVYKDYFPVLGGIENHIRILAEAQVDAGHQTAVSVCHPGPASTDSFFHGVHLLRAGRFCTAASMPISLRQPLWIHKQQADIVHLHSPYPLGELSAWIGLRHTPLVITHHSDIVRQKKLLRLYGPLYRRILSHASRIIVTSASYRETSPWLSDHAAKCRIVPLGIDPAPFRLKEPCKETPGRLLFVGRLRYYKGLDTLLQAIVPLTEVSLTVAGDGPMRQQWQSLTDRLAIGHRVSFLGDISEDSLPDLYRQADLFVLPANSRAEAFGTVLLEAMASGLPCITTEVGTGTSWVVQDGVTGYIVPLNRPDALADTIRKSFSDPDRLHRMGLAGRQRMEQEFTARKMIHGVEEVYKECLGDGR